MRATPRGMPAAWLCIAVIAMPPCNAAAEEAPGPLVLTLGDHRTLVMLGLKVGPPVGAVHAGNKGTLHLSFHSPGPMLRPERTCEGLFRAFKAWAAVRNVGAVAVRGIFGTVGESGDAIHVWWTRTGPETWERRVQPRERLDVPVGKGLETAARNEKMEGTALRTAEKFVAALEKLALDEAWLATSAAYRARTSKEEFDEAVTIAGRYEGGGARSHLVSYYLAATAASGVGIVLVRFGVEANGQAGYKDVELNCGPGGCQVDDFDFKLPLGHIDGPPPAVAK